MNRFHPNFAMQVALIIVLVIAGSMTAPAGAQEAVVLQDRRIRVQAQLSEGVLREKYLALRGGQWIEVASADGQSAGAVSLVARDGKAMTAESRAVRLQDGELVEEWAAGPHRITRRVRLTDGPWVRVSTRIEPAGRLELHAFFDRFRSAARPDWSYSPSVGGFNPDAQYKAPLILVQAERMALAIVPDVATLDRPSLMRCNHALDLDVPGGPLMSVGFMPARRSSHSVYSEDSRRAWTIEQPVENCYYLLLDADAPSGQAYRQAVRFHWDRFGRLEQAHAAEQQVGTDARYRQLALWDDWRPAVWEGESRQTWLRVPLADGSTGGGARTKRWGPGPSVYLSSWFNTLRTSYGMALYARRTGNRELLDLARQTVELALKAPGRDGAFKCIAVPTDKGVVWAAGDGSGGSTADGFLGYDMSWTAYWLLRWRESKLPGDELILPRCRQLARFLTARQFADGMLPTRFGENGSVQEEKSRTVKAETGPAVLFLLALHAQDPDARYLDAAKRGLQFLEKDVIPLRQWYDYETFWSCSPRGIALDSRSGQWPANNLALTQTVAACLQAWRTTRDDSYLAKGEALLDYLLLYQQCWTNPVIEQLSCPAMLLGGFTTQNSDAEWSDARQSQIGNILLDYYRATGKAEYLERGVAALRSQFPISPSENWAHEGYGRKAGVSSFHWGTGSGMAGIEMEEDFLRDAMVDVAAGRGVGFNGLDLTDCAVAEGRIAFNLRSPLPWPRKATVVFRNAAPGAKYRLIVNGDETGPYAAGELEAGVAIAPARHGR
ncbi:MAG: hypothetical protein ACHRHE_22085 [Tepidisphaerales bacterium]